MREEPVTTTRTHTVGETVVFKPRFPNEWIREEDIDKSRLQENI